MKENSLSRIPFLIRDELMILSMARWMRFIGVVKVIGGLVTGFMVLVGLIYVGSELGTGLPALGKVGRLVAENQVVFFAIGSFALILTVVGTLLGFVLYQAADDFERVARGDEADQDYITAGIVRLNTYFKVSILLGLAAVLVAIAAGIGLAAKLSVGS
ncbi:MAG: hypothetical protein ACHRXM_11820 [Isosphaerales bacterium]